MNRHDALERDLTMWFDDIAMPRRPDYTTDIVEMTARLPQRRWTLERWLPMTVIQMRRAAPPFPWRTAAVLVALLAILVAGLAYVGSRPRLPPPFGLAGNGLVAYAKDGDILTVDPATGVRNWMTAGDDVDALPRWSPDGTRLAFLRAASTTTTDDIAAATRRVVIVDQARNVLTEGVGIFGIDPDAFAWSPDGRYIAVGGPGLFIVDATSGGTRSVGVGYQGLDFYWRPNHPTELLLRGETSDGTGLVLVDVDEPESARLVAADGDHFLRPSGWTPDGQRIVFTRLGLAGDASAPADTRILDLTTRAAVDIEAGYADISNDGSRIVAIDGDGRPCIASIDGGPCIAIADAGHTYDGTFAGGTFWAPDDQSIVATISADVTPRSGDLLMLDPQGRGSGAPPPWMAEGAESWQRVAR